MFQKVERILIDDDQDSIVIEVLLGEPTKGVEKHPVMLGIGVAFITVFQ